VIDCIVDLSHWNGAPDFAAAKAAGLQAVILKATEGVSGVDPAFATNRAAARTVGVPTGAYHFIVGGDGAAQAAHFLSVAQPGDLLALDFEENPFGLSATYADAAAFIGALPVTPVLYCGGYLKGLGAAPAGLTACPLWLSEFGPTPRLPVGWADWTLWQYSDGTVNAPPDPVPGIGACDRDRFNGTADELAAFWAAHSVRAT
jgi:lysozyme